jgi:hypothetical protein
MTESFEALSDDQVAAEIATWAGLFRCSHNSTLFSRIECVELKPFG